MAWILGIVCFLLLLTKMQKMEVTMATSKADVLAAIKEEKEEVVASIQALKDQLANGSAITESDLNEIIAEVKGIHTA